MPGEGAQRCGWRGDWEEGGGGGGGGRGGGGGGLGGGGGKMGGGGLGPVGGWGGVERRSTVRGGERGGRALLLSST